MAEKGNLGSDPLFIGLTRPATIMGVHYIIFLMNLMGHLLIFVNELYPHKFMTIPSLAVVHGICYLICLREPRAIELFMTRYGKCSKCRNRTHHKFTNSYDLV